MNDNTLRASCSDCYFRHAALCALLLDKPCPTFRHYSRGAFAPPQPVRLTPPPLDKVAETRLVTQSAAA